MRHLTTCFDYQNVAAMSKLAGSMLACASFKQHYFSKFEVAPTRWQCGQKNKRNLKINISHEKVMRMVTIVFGMRRKTSLRAFTEVALCDTKDLKGTCFQHSMATKTNFSIHAVSIPEFREFLFSESAVCEVAGVLFMNGAGTSLTTVKL